MSILLLNSHFCFFSFLVNLVRYLHLYFSCYCVLSTWIVCELIHKELVFEAYFEKEIIVAIQEAIFKKLSTFFFYMKVIVLRARKRWSKAWLSSYNCGTTIKHMVGWRTSIARVNLAPIIFDFLLSYQCQPHMSWVSMGFERIFVRKPNTTP